jgi:hypothetical protein
VLGVGCLQEANSSLYRSWDDLALSRANWDGPIILKGIQTIDDALRWMPTWMASPCRTIARAHGPSEERARVEARNSALLYD